MHKGTVSPKHFKKDPHLIKLHTEQGPEEGGVVTFEIYD